MTVYDYIITVQATDAAGEVQRYVQQTQAYSLSEAVMSALLELDAQFGITSRGCDVKVLSARPDVEKARQAVRAHTKELFDEVSSALRMPARKQ